MNKAERENWIINLEDVSKEISSEIVQFICEQHGDKNIYSIRSCELHEIYNELFQYAIDS